MVAKKKVAAKKPVAKKKVPAKKKSLVKRLLERKKKGSITRKGLLIGAGTVVVLALGFVGYSVWQNMSADAGSTAGRGWTTVGSFNNGVAGTVSVCKSLVPKYGYSIKASSAITKVTKQPGSSFKFGVSVSGKAGNQVPVAVGQVSTVSYSYAKDGSKITVSAGTGDGNRGAVLFTKVVTINNSILNC